MNTIRVSLTTATAFELATSAAVRTVRYAIFTST